MKPESAFAPVSELLPHRGRALLLDRVLAHDGTTTICAVDPAASVLYRDGDGSVPAWVGLEYMAQTIAAHGGLLDRSAGRSVRPGFFLGSRRLSFHVPCFAPGDRLEVAVSHLRGTTGLVAFDCSIRAAGGDDAMVSGVLTVYLLESFEALVEGFSQQSSGESSGDSSKDD